MQTAKGRSGSQEAARRISPKAIRQLKTTGLESESASSPTQARTPKDKGPKVIDRRSPRSPIAEKKRPSRITELESQVTQLQEELKRVNGELSLSESWKKEALEDANNSVKQLLPKSSKIGQSEKQIPEPSASENTNVIEVQKISVDAVNLASLTFATSVTEQLKDQVEIIAESEAKQDEQRKSADVEVQALKTKLVDTLSLVEDVKNQLRDSKESEAQAQALASDTLAQLEAARQTINSLRSEGKKALDDYSSIALELELSMKQVKSLKAVVSKLEEDLRNTVSQRSEETADNHDTDNHKQQAIELLEAENYSLKSEVEQLRSSLKASEMQHGEESLENTTQMQNAFDELKQLKSVTSAREEELEAEIKQGKAKIEELKAELMDKETELQGISEENEGLSMKLNQSVSSQRESVLDTEVKNFKESVMRLKTALTDKETELQNIVDENKTLKFELNKRKANGGQFRNNMIKELEAARAAEQEAVTKLGLIMEEAEKNNKRVNRAMEQLEAAQSVNSEMEAELRRIKVQSNQWRKAAEAAVSMLSAGNNIKVMDRAVSLDTGKVGSPYHEDTDDDMLKKKNGNMLKKIGVLWKKPPK